MDEKFYIQGSHHQGKIFPSGKSGNFNIFCRGSGKVSEFLSGLGEPNFVRFMPWGRGKVREFKSSWPMGTLYISKVICAIVHKVLNTYIESSCLEIGNWPKRPTRTFSVNRFQSEWLATCVTLARVQFQIYTEEQKISNLTDLFMPLERKKSGLKMPHIVFLVCCDLGWFDMVCFSGLAATWCGMENKPYQTTPCVALSNQNFSSSVHGIPN